MMTNCVESLKAIASSQNKNTGQRHNTKRRRKSRYGNFCTHTMDINNDRSIRYYGQNGKEMRPDQNISRIFEERDLSQVKVGSSKGEERD